MEFAHNAKPKATRKQRLIEIMGDGCKKRAWSATPYRLDSSVYSLTGGENRTGFNTAADQPGQQQDACDPDHSFGGQAPTRSVRFLVHLSFESPCGPRFASTVNVS